MHKTVNSMVFGSKYCSTIYNLPYWAVAMVS